MTPAETTRCLVPAAGRGTRMRPVTSTVPKELLPVGARPLLQWCVTEALEGGFDEIGVVVRDAKRSLVEYLEEGRWREGLLPGLGPAAERARIVLFRQERPEGVVDAIFSAAGWVEEVRPFAVLLPDNVRIAGPPPISSEHLEEAASEGGGLVACHKIGPETAPYYGDVGRAELETLVPAGGRPAVTGLQRRGEGAAFRAPPEGAWRLMPRYVVTADWIEVARRVAERTADDDEVDDVAVHRRLAAEGGLRAVPWSGTMVDAGRPVGYQYAHHLLHQAEARRREAEEEAAGGERPIRIDLPGGRG